MRDTTQTANEDPSTGLKDDTLSDFQIILMAPNPTGGPFKVTCNQELVNAVVSITDLQGRTVSLATVSGSEVPLDISHLAAGTYEVVVTTSYGRTGKSIVKASQK
ncbi:MAG: T9SS type A sorting domain-containing protein [Bacteroidetes bacterium]|nr:T9SS type A sorting domain-containing protein [Bacteroidota bacterium]